VHVCVRVSECLLFNSNFLCEISVPHAQMLLVLGVHRQLQNYSTQYVKNIQVMVNNILNIDIHENMV